MTRLTDERWPKAADYAFAVATDVDGSVYISGNTQRGTAPNDLDVTTIMCGGWLPEVGEHLQFRR